MKTDTPRRALARAVADPSWLWWAMLAGCGVTLCVIGLVGAAGRKPESGEAARLVAHIPDPLAALALASGILAALLILSLLVPRGVRRKRKEDEEYEFYHEPLRVPAWVVLVLWALVLLPFVGVAYLLWSGWTPFKEGVAPLLLPHGLSIPPQRRFPLAGPTAAASPPLWNVVVTTLTLCASLGGLAVLLWILFGERLAWWWASPLPERRQMLAEAVDESLDNLARELDARVAIIKCYRRFEQVLARSRVPRAPWQTPVEFMREALGRLPLPPGAVRRLTELFEVARFSNDRLGSADRASAFESLVEIRAGLEQERVDAPAA